MESILVKHINMPQTSKHVRIQGGTDVTAAGTYTFDIAVPEGAIIEKVTAVTKTQFDSATSAAMTVGDSAAADTFLASVNLKTVTTRSESAVGKQMTAVTPYTNTDDGESNYLVRVTVTTVGATTAGDVYVWADFRFDPNVAYS